MQMQQMHAEIDRAAIGVAGAVMDCVNHGVWQDRRKEESSFLNKISKIILFLRPRQGRGSTPNGKQQEIKVFCFFSSEKKDFLAFGASRREGTPHPSLPHKGEGEGEDRTATVMRGRR
jgi:hypothetical protein